MLNQLKALFSIFIFLFTAGFGFTGLIGFGAHDQAGPVSCGFSGDLISENFDAASDPVSGWTAVNNSHSNQASSGELISISSGGSDDYMEEGLTGRSEVWICYKVNVNSSPTVNGVSGIDRVLSIKSGPNSSRISISLVDAAGAIKFAFGDRDNAGDNFAVVSSPLVDLGNFQTITLHYKIETSVGAGDGKFEVWIDSTKVVDTSSASDTVTNFDTYRFGNALTHASAAYTSHIEDVEVGSTGSGP